MTEDVNERKDVIIVGTSEYPLIKKGRAQADQVAGIARWIKLYGLPAAKEVGATNIADNGMQFLLNVIGGLSSDALIDLFIIITGCQYSEAEEYFDIAQLIDVAVQTYENQPSFKKVIDRFLPGLASTEPTEISQKESSTTSEEPTDG